MNNYKIKVNNEAESKEAQELFFELGYKWSGAVATYLSIGGFNFITAYPDEMRLAMGWGDDADKELTLPQLRDLVVLHRNDVKNANWVTEGDDQIYQDSNGKSFIFREQGWDELQRHEMRQAMWEKIKPKPQSTEAEQGLISGADALRALADGKDVQWISKDFPKWDDLDTWNANTRNFLDEKCIIEGGFKYRLKPRTIKLEIEIPACGKNYKHGQLIWILNSLEPNEYCSVILDESDELPAYWWETEEEIKKVVAALRGIKG